MRKEEVGEGAAERGLRDRVARPRFLSVCVFERVLTVQHPSF